ncbi:EAL domain-containing protein, partial [Oxalobacteraceae bacterium OM1]
LYYCVARLFLMLALPASMASPFWPPAAIALCACLAWGPSMAAAVAAAAVACAWHAGTGLLPSLLIGAGNAGEALLAVALLKRWVGAAQLRMMTERPFRCLAVAAIASLLGATVGTVALALDRPMDADVSLIQWITWWLGDTTGIIVVMPLLLASRPAFNLTWRPARIVEGLAFSALLPTITYVTFAEPFGILPLSYLPLPFVLWAAFRFGIATLAWSIALICAIAIWSTLRGNSIFAVQDLRTSLLLVMVYVTLVSVTGMAIGGLVSRQRRTEFALVRERDELERRVQEKTEALQQDVEQRRAVEQALAEAQSIAQMGSWSWDVSSRTLRWSAALYALFGLDPSSFAPTVRAARELVHPDDLPGLQAAIDRCLAQGEPFRMEHRIVLPDSGLRIVEARGKRVEEGDGARIVGTLQDITDAKQIENSLREAEERYRMVVELSPDAILVQREGRFVFANRAACDLFGARSDDLLGESVFRYIHPDFHAITRDRMQQLERGEPIPAVEEKIIRPDGTAIDVELNAASFSHESRPASLMILRDITERRRTLEQMAYLAHYDSLTGLPNRMLFLQRLEHALIVAERPGRSLEVLFLDLDRFKNINDTLGHAVGDRVLQETAQRLQAILRESDTVARLGGDEFVVLVENIDEPHRGGFIAEKILAAFAPPFLRDKEPLSISTSIGIASYPDDGTDADTLLKNADIAMYRAKESGRNNYRYYSAEMNRHTAERLALEYALGHALARGQLALHYQPKVDVPTGRITGMEALLRWHHPTLGMLGPDRFIDLAEETGLIRPIGYWVIRTACAQNKAWQESSSAALKVAVNLSLRQLTDEQLVDRVRGILDDTGLDPQCLEFELTESAVMFDPDMAIGVLEALRRMGVSVAIDDFGVGYSSLAYLKQFPIRAVKIDRSFVHGVPDDRGDSAITKAIIGLAHSLECAVIAEGAETQQQFDFLREHDCDSVQGNYFSAPLNAEAFGALLRAPPAPHLH